MKVKFDTTTGLVPVIIQNANSEQVLMLGYMNEEALQKTISDQRVCFFSRSKKRLWVKGESSGNFLDVVSIQEDCDKDALLVRVIPNGPTCHTGTTSCFGERGTKGTLYELEKTIEQRIKSKDPTSYTRQLYERGINKIAQKVGEEAVEVVIEAMCDNEELFLNESADLLFHLLLLLKAKNKSLEEVEYILQNRKKR